MIEYWLSLYETQPAEIQQRKENALQATVGRNLYRHRVESLLQTFKESQ